MPAVRTGWRKVLAKTTLGLCAAVGAGMLLTACSLDAETGDRAEGPAASAQQAAATTPQGFPEIIQELQHDWSIPGLAVAVVERDRIPYLKAFGFKERGAAAPLSENSVFGIASVTKTFVAVAVATLVDDGKLRWDDRVVDHLPDFKVLDPYVTANVTIRDLLAHRSGIASYADLLEENPNLTEPDLVKRLAFADQSMSFRSGYQYSSYTFVVLAQLIEALSGKPWADYMREAVLEPLALNGVYVHADEFVTEGNVLPTGDGWSTSISIGQAALKDGIDAASPHVAWERFHDHGLVFEKAELDYDLSHFHRTAIDPGQSMYASIEHLARWTQMWLNDGELDGTRLLDVSTIKEMRGKHGLAKKKNRAWPLDWKEKASAPWASRRRVGVGLGLFMFDYRGHTLYGHSGSELGYGSLMVVDPNEEFAVVAMINNSSRSFGAVDAVVQTLLDHRYGFEFQDWSAHYMELAKEGLREYFDHLSALTASRPAGAETNPDFGKYVGHYANPFAGPIEVLERDGMLVATTGESYFLELRYWGGNDFKAVPIGPIRFWLDVSIEPSETDGQGRLVIEHSYLHKPLVYRAVP